jgi:hypothetical protein
MAENKKTGDQFRRFSFEKGLLFRLLRFFVVVF